MSSNTENDELKFLREHIAYEDDADEELTCLINSATSAPSSLASLFKIIPNDPYYHSDDTFIDAGSLYLEELLKQRRPYFKPTNDVVPSLEEMENTHMLFKAKNID